MQYMYIMEPTHPTEDAAGNGKTVWFSLSTAENYYYADGEWSGITLSSGNAFKQIFITDTNEDNWIFTYSGNIENDSFHGDINITWQKPDGSQYDSATVHAEHGTLDYLWKEGGQICLCAGK